MESELLAEHVLGDMLFRYSIGKQNRIVSLLIVPVHLASSIAADKQYDSDSLVQVKLVGDDYPNRFSHGRSMRNSESVLKLRYDNQTVIQENDRTKIITKLTNNRGHILSHIVCWHHGDQAVAINCAFQNSGKEEIKLEMLASYAIGGITPFEIGDTPDRLVLHRIRSNWSAEGRLESTPIEALQLEPSWAKYGANSIRFGQVGTMPVRNYFPFVAVEDVKRKVIWAAQVAYAGSWQMEVYRKDDALNLSGGLADREFGHWVKKVGPGEIFETPAAFLSVAEGGVGTITGRLAAMQQRVLKTAPEAEQNLPILFNEFCTTWGQPSEKNIQKIAEKLRGKGIKYLVIDAGWYADGEEAWDHRIGDWHVANHRFPNGLKRVGEIIRENGMIPGIWFELEVCTRHSTAFSMVDHLLKRDGVPITAGDRRFWDMNDPFVIDYLTERVINLLRKNRFGYLKIDYNDNIGIGCDDEDSLGEGLRKQVAGIMRFINLIRENVPGIVIENCSSGGHRLEPSIMSITSMSSFSDAHECPEIPIIAANLHRCILPRQSQIWAVLRKEDSLTRLVYSISNTFLGRMCLSGDIHELNESQWDIVNEGMRFYERIAPIIKHGSSMRWGPEVKSYRHPVGWQGVRRLSLSENEALIVLHTFEGELPDQVKIQLPAQKTYRIDTIYSEEKYSVELQNEVLTWQPSKPFQAIAIHLISL